MANFKQVNKAIAKAYPDLGFTLARGVGYVYFLQNDCILDMDTITAHPTSTSTEDMIKIALQDLDYFIKK